ncbi:hypothetical protein C8R43DRAFT_1120756 [Mycena crocata]|nr:hypothetical protein C8R43DRAFT_1120756 [Mycena crocata]
MPVDSVRPTQGQTAGHYNWREFIRNMSADQQREVRRLIGASGSQPPLRRITREMREAANLRRIGSRAVWSPALSREDMYLDGIVPSQPAAGDRVHHKCSLCNQVKCNPVSYACGDSHCFACIRLHLESNWTCPSCDAVITAEPCRHTGEEASIAYDFPAWTKSEKGEPTYSWEGLTFPRPRIVYELDSDDN